MSGNNLKTHYSAKELLAFSLSALPNSVQGIIYQAKKQGWETQKRVGKGGGSEYALETLPENIQTEIRSRFMSAVVEAKPKKLPAVRAEVDVGNLTTKQRDIADARMTLVAYVLELEGSMSRIKAITYLCNLAKQGEMPPHLAELVSLANAKKTEKRICYTEPRFSENSRQKQLHILYHIRLRLRQTQITAVHLLRPFRQFR